MDISNPSHNTKAKCKKPISCERHGDVYIYGSFSPLKSRKTTPDAALATVTNVYLNTLGCISEEGRAEDDGTQPTICSGD